MANEERILEILIHMQGDITQIRGDITQMQGDITQMQGDISDLKAGYAKMQGEITQMQGDITQMQGDISDLKAGYVRLEDRIHHTNAYLELDVEKRFDAVNEGIDTILERLVSQEQVDALEDDVMVLKAVVKSHSHDIAELKRAQ